MTAPNKQTRNNLRRIVVAGKLPPPVVGQNFIVERILRILSGQPGIVAEHWDFPFASATSLYRKPRLRKFLQLFGVAFDLFRKRASGPIDWLLYPSGGPHFVPVVRDLVLLPLALLCSRRVVVHFQAAGIAERIEAMPRFLRWSLRTVSGWAWGAAVLTEFGRRDAEALAFRRIVVLPNGVEDRYDPATLHEAQLAVGPPRILAVGLLCEDKGTPVLLEAFATLLRTEPEARLTLVGECIPPYDSTILREQINILGIQNSVRLGGVRLGRLLDEEYRHHSVVVFASTAPYESFGLVLAEAMMHARPVVVSRWRANGEVAGEDVGGVIYDPFPDHVVSLHAALVSCLAQRAKWVEWGRRNRQSFLSRFTMELFAKRLISLFDESSWPSPSGPMRSAVQKCSGGPLARERVVIAGKLPPPIGGQNLVVEELLRSVNKLAGYAGAHWDFPFATTTDRYRRLEFRKVLQTFGVVAGLIRLRLGGRIDWMIYPSGGPHLIPAVRDAVLLPVALLFARRLVVHFQAAGIAERLDALPGAVRWILLRVCRRAWGAAVLTEYGRRDAQALGFRRVEVLPNGVDDRVQAAIAEPADHVRLLAVGHLCADKGTPELLRAFAQVLRKEPQATLRLVGEAIPPFSLDMLNIEIRALGIERNVRTTGIKRGIALDEEFRNASLFVFPSVAPYESFGLVVVEAMMFGLPVVVSRWRGNAEVVGSDFGGVMYEPYPDHVSSLASALLTAFEQRERWNEWGKRNRRIYEERYTKERFRARFAELLTVDGWRGSLTSAPALTSQPRNIPTCRKQARSCVRVVVAGKMPPPIGGQNINIKRVYDLLQADERLVTEYWELPFSTHLAAFRKGGVQKLQVLLAAIADLVRLRAKGRIDHLILPTGGPHILPIIRDMVLIPAARLATSGLILHFRAAGIAETLQRLPALLAMFVRSTYRLAPRAFVLTEYGRRDPLALGIRSHSVVPNGLEDWNPSRSFGGGVTQEISVLAVGHICPDKGTPTLLAAFAGIDAPPGMRLRLRLVGQCMPPYTFSDLQADIARLELTSRVTIAGLRRGSELTQEYRRASLFVFPTVAPYESFGMVLIEAMMFGLPIVVSKWRGNADVVGTPMSGGILYDPSSDHVAALGNALSEAIARRTEWAAWGRRNRARYESEFTEAHLRARLLSELGIEKGQESDAKTTSQPG